MNKTTIAAVSISLAVVLFISVNILSDLMFRHARIDLTQSKAYTLSEGTKTILEMAGMRNK